MSGLMGLCMGFSFVSLAEILYYLVMGLVLGCKKILSKKNGEGSLSSEVWTDK